MQCAASQHNDGMSLDSILCLSRISHAMPAEACVYVYVCACGLNAMVVDGGHVCGISTWRVVCVHGQV